MPSFNKLSYFFKKEETLKKAKKRKEIQQLANQLGGIFTNMKIVDQKLGLLLETLQMGANIGEYTYQTQEKTLKEFMDERNDEEEIPEEKQVELAELVEE